MTLTVLNVLKYQMKSKSENSFLREVALIPFSFSGAFEKLRKLSSSCLSIRPFVMSVYPSVRHICLSVRSSFCPHGTTRLPLNGFSLNLLFENFFENLSRKFKVHQNQRRITAILHEDQYIFIINFLSFLPRMRNV